MKRGVLQGNVSIGQHQPNRVEIDQTRLPDLTRGGRPSRVALP